MFSLSGVFLCTQNPFYYSSQSSHVPLSSPQIAFAFSRKSRAFNAEIFAYQVPRLPIQTHPQLKVDISDSGDVFYLVDTLCVYVTNTIKNFIFCVGSMWSQYEVLQCCYQRYNGMATRRLFAASSADIIDGWRGRALTKQKFSIHHTFKLQSDHNKLLLNKQS